MTVEQIDLIRRSFDAIWPLSRKLAEVLYGRLFELVPDARRLFPKDMERQYLKLMDTIAAIVGALDNRDLLQSHHVQFGAAPSHFHAFGEALIWSLERQLGAAFSPEVKEAWATLYNDVQRDMMRSARSERERPAKAPRLQFR